MPFPAGLRALNHRDFRLFWTGQLISLIGTWMQSVGQSWLVLELTNSPFRLGLIGALQFGPMLLFSFPAGAIADRLPKRRLILATQTALMLQAFLLATLAWTGHVQYWHVAVLASLYGVANTLDMPTRQSFIVEMVGKDDLMNAIALNSAIFNGARVVGPAAAGMLVARYGVPIAFLLNGVSFVAVLCALLAMHTEGLPLSRPRASMFQEIATGIRYALHTPSVSLILILLLSVSLFLINHSVLIPLLARDVLHAGAEGFGWLMAALGMGAVTGALGLALLGEGRPRFAVLVAAAIFLAMAMLSLAVVHHFRVAIPLLILAGLSQIIFMASCNTTLQVTVPDTLRGRIMSLYAFVFVGVTPIGSFFVGSIAEVFGVPVAFAAGGGLGLLCILGLTWRWTRGRTWRDLMVGWP
ncbi:MAG TPA: MFS transporter [Candidatus Methylomirabilis sp.]|nr:MFS transporter [Candidatus Methylomirabilis sp.]